MVSPALTHMPAMDEAAPPSPPASLEAFEALYRAEFRSVWKFLYQLGARGSWADDLTHDVFLTAFRRFHTYDPSCSAKAWLRGIAWRIAADHRRLRFHQREVGEEEGEQIESGGLALDEEIARQQARQLLDDALARLDTVKRAVFVMHELEGMTVPEIAEAMGAGVPTTYSRLRLAREQLASAVKQLRLLRGMP